ncbi:MAG: hypothetical protein ABF916_01465, partial [Acetobacter fabarum]
MSDTTDEQFPHDEGLPSPEPEGPGLFGEPELPAQAAAPPPQPINAPATPYRVLARKYRPTTFDD